MWNWIICIFEDKERKWVRDAVLLFFFLMACGILVPHQGLKLCPLQWNHSLNHWRVSVSHSVVSDSLRTHDHCLPGSSVLGILQARILEWGAILFSRGSSKPRDQTHISCIAGRFFTIWATREAHSLHYFFFYPKPSDVNILISFASVPSAYISPRNILGHMKNCWVPSPVILKF